ncbi:S-layer homology domain-containing protein, partial [Paenibacillus yanchengensis]
VDGDASKEYVVKRSGNVYTFYYTAANQTITVHHLEKGTNDKLEEPTTVTGKTGKTVTLQSLQINGYEVDGDASKEYVVKRSGNVYTFYYTAANQTITVHHLEKGTNDKLEEPTTVTGKTGKTVTLQSLQINGYEVDGDASKEYVVKRSGNVYTFYYTAEDQTITVRHLEKGTNNKLEEPTTATGKTGEEVELSSVVILGYTVDGEATVDYTVKRVGNEYTFFYTKNAPVEKSVTIYHYKEGTTDAVHAPTSASGVIGTEITLNSVNVTDYKVVGNTTVPYTVQAEDNSHIFYYTADTPVEPVEKSVTIYHYKEGTMEEVHAPTSASGVIGTEITLNSVNVTDYKVIGNTTVPYTVQAEDNSHIFYYTADTPVEPVEKSVTIYHYKEGTTEEVHAPTSASGVIGTEITLNSVNVTDYTVVGNTTVPYTVKAEDNTYTFYYTADEPVEQIAKVTVKYVNAADNTELKASTLVTGIIGDTVILEAPSIEGFVLENAEAIVSYELVSAESVYEFRYVELADGSFKLVVKHEVDGTVVSRQESAKLAGDTINTSPLSNANYRFLAVAVTPEDGFTKDDVGNVSGLMPELDVEVTYSYEDITPPTDLGTVVVHYREKGSNNELAPSQQFTGAIGSTLVLTPVSVNQYSSELASYEFVVVNEMGEYTFLYTKNPPVVYPPYEPKPTPLPPLPPVTPLPPLPPTLDMENHFNYVRGYPDGTVQPEGQISREEVAAIFYRLLDEESRNKFMTTDHSFTDVKKARWSNRHIATMQNAGIITGYEDGSFRPGQSITRAEFAAIASRFDKLNDTKNDKFSDISGHWAEKYIKSAANKGWIAGYEDKTFRPDQYITRAEAMKFINSVLNRKLRAEDVHEDTKQWPDNPSTKWYYEDVLEATNHHEYSRDEEDYELWDEVLPLHIYQE